MGSTAVVHSAFAAFDEAVQALGALDFDGLPAEQLLAAVERLETGRRRLTALAHDLAAAVAGRGEEEIGGSPHRLLADTARVSPGEARRRLADAGRLTPRLTLTGHPLPPELPATAKAWQAGLLDPEHLRVIKVFVRDLPTHLPAAEVERAEAFLAEKAAELRPDQLQKVADRLAVTLNPDGRFSDADRDLRRGFTWCGGQRPDGMSIGKLVATPELRALLDAWLAKFAAPGMCNPADERPATAGSPGPEVVDRDARGHGQRQHDALAFLVRGRLGDPRLGKHRGLPVTVIATATVDQLCSAAGYAVTGSGSLLPMRDLIRMAGRARHYLCVFESHSQRPLYLGRARRIASADQRLALHAADRGCTAPGCDVPGDRCDVHHVVDWSAGGRTDIDSLTFGCGPDHGLVEPGRWRTRKRRDGRTEWIPPPGRGLRGGVNDYHHPERLLPAADRQSAGQDPGTVVGDGDGVLPVRGVGPVEGDDSPLVVEDTGGGGTQGEHRLDRQHRARDQ